MYWRYDHVFNVICKHSLLHYTGAMENTGHESKLHVLLDVVTGTNSNTDHHHRFLFLLLEISRSPIALLF